MDTTPAPATTTFPTDPAAGLRVEVHDEQWVTITLARPDRLNSQSPVMWDELTRLRHELPGTVRVVVLRADGRAFSAGLDRGLMSADHPQGILHLPRMSQADATAAIAGWQRAFDWSSRPAVVSIAAVQGHAVGGGFQLALGTDIRIVADDVAFCMAEPMIGIVPDLGGTKRLVDLVGVSRATEICLTGRRIGAEEALRIGLASAVAAPAELDDAVRRTVDAILAVDRDAAAETKALLQGVVAGAGRTQDEQQAAEREAQYRRLRTMTGLDAED